MIRVSVINLVKMLAHKLCTVPIGVGLQQGIPEIAWSIACRGEAVQMIMPLKMLKTMLAHAEA